MTPSAPAGRTMLVVDDNEIEREGLALLLRRAGYAVELAADGQQSLDRLRSGPAPP